MSVPLPSPEASIPTGNAPEDLAPEDPPAWRQEIAARLNRYQTRRKPRPPRYPSLQLRFDAENPATSADPISAESHFSQRMATSSNQALALDSFVGFIDPATPAADVSPSIQQTPQLEASPANALRHASEFSPPPPAQTAQTAKIIEFPRSWAPAPAPLDELAEPVFDRSRPRILEAPDLVPPAPALGGITIEPARKPDLDKRPGIDIPLQTAPLARRILSAAVDALIIAAAGAVFALIFWKLTAIQPPRFQIFAMAAGFSALFWSAYQYLLLVYAGTTPGLLLARLQLARFDGSPAGRRLRRWRVLASFLSAVSLGMGYVWVFLDEDALCWHDRITHTYLAPKMRTN